MHPLSDLIYACRTTQLVCSSISVFNIILNITLNLHNQSESAQLSIKINLKVIPAVKDNNREGIDKFGL